MLLSGRAGAALAGSGRIRSPRSAAWTRPVAMRHRSTASCRASATMAFLRAAPLVLGTPRPSTLCQRFIPRYSGWKITTLQASWIKSRRRRGLPCLVIAPSRRLSPLPFRQAQGPERSRRAALARAEPEEVAHLPCVFEAVRVDEFARDQLVAQLAFADKERRGRRGRGRRRRRGGGARDRGGGVRDKRRQENGRASGGWRMGEPASFASTCAICASVTTRSAFQLSSCSTTQAGIRSVTRFQLAEVHRGGGGE